jgi:hydroxyacyl-ACP dehydratase HTD2-like protein with hotdog domain
MHYHSLSYTKATTMASPSQKQGGPQNQQWTSLFTITQVAAEVISACMLSGHFLGIAFTLRFCRAPQSQTL